MSITKKIIFGIICIGATGLFVFGIHASDLIAAPLNGDSISSIKSSSVASNGGVLISEAGSCPVITVYENETYFDFADCPIEEDIALYGYDAETEEEINITIEASARHVVAIGCKKRGSCRAGAYSAQHDLRSVVFDDGTVLDL